MSLRVLIVDDVGAQKGAPLASLGDRRDAWDIQFAQSGSDALAKVREQHIDAVVSTMKLPDMNGPELLESIRKVQPEALRIIKSDPQDKRQLARTIGPAHQYVSTRAAATDLIDTVEKGVALRRYVSSEAMRTILGRIEVLPMPKKVLLDMIRELDQENANAQSIADLIGQDLSLMTQVLRFANSAFFALPSTITTPYQAVKALGFDNIRALVLAAGVFDVFDIDRTQEQASHRLAMNSFSIGTLAQKLAEETPDISQEIASCAMFAGSISHIGTLLLRCHVSHTFQRAANLADSKDITIHEAEERLIGISHGAIGGYLLGLWGFQDRLTEVVAYHHAPSKAGHKTPSALTFVHVAQHLCSTMNAGRSAHEESPHALDMVHLEETGLVRHLDRWKDIASKALNA